MSAAQVTEAHRELARRIMFEFTQAGTATASDVRMAAQIIADSEAKACAELRAELDAQCLLNAKGSEREAVLLRRVDRMAKECLNLRADLDAIKAIRNEETARAERAEAKVRVLREALQALRDQQNNADRPLCRAHWQMAMDEAGLALAATEGDK